MLEDAGTALTAAATLLTALTALVAAAVSAIVTLRRRGRTADDDVQDAARRTRPPKEVDIDQVMALAIEAEVKRRAAVAELEALRAQQARQREMGES